MNSHTEAASTAIPSPATLAQRLGVTTALLLLSISLLIFRGLTSYTKGVRKTNGKRRRLLIERLGLPAEKSRSNPDGPRYRIIGFFHPYCNAGGGGERVLFEAVRYHLRPQADDDDEQKTICVIYTGDVAHAESLTGQARSQLRMSLPSESSSIADGGGTASKTEILSKVQERFGIPLNDTTYSSRIAFLPLQSRGLVSDKYWTRLTMLGQSFGGAILAKEACEELIPDVFIDTMGYAFSFPVVRLFTSGRGQNVKIGAYVHYPTISTDMLRRVASRQSGHTNNSQVAASWWKSRVKLTYYHLYARLYIWALRRADVLVVNGSWTANHINNLLGKKDAAKVVYPPCDVSTLCALPLSPKSGRGKTLVSLAQFRPEKEHATQVKVLAKIFEKRPELKEQGVKLVMMGSCRNSGDEDRIEGLKKLAKQLGVETHFVVNAPYKQILSHLSTASIGLSTMIDEHFGMNVVEFMAAGLITLSHASAGPLLDIAVPDEDGKLTGYHALSIDEFSDRAVEILDSSEAEQLEIRTRARKRATEVFSTEAFCQMWEDRLWQRLVKH